MASYILPIAQPRTLRIGSLVIVNYYDKPNSRFVAVVTQLADSDAKLLLARYLAADLNSQFPAGVHCGYPTMLWEFGVGIRYDTQTNEYQCYRVMDGQAMYEDVDSRQWQETLPSEMFNADEDNLALALEAQVSHDR